MRRRFKTGPPDEVITEANLKTSIAMYNNDHAPPHFHAKYGDYEEVITIDLGGIVEGRLPPRVFGLVQEWREYHRTELAEDWNLDTKSCSCQLPDLKRPSFKFSLGQVELKLLLQPTLRSRVEGNGQSNCHFRADSGTAV
jgi:hypothetical protein